MFGFLEFSDRYDYNPLPFCLVFKDHSGQPVNVAVQQDAQEFLNIMFDKLEKGSTWWRQLVQGVFGGKLVNQLTCQGCGSLREKEELFYSLSLTVKGINNIQQSLGQFIQSEIINDFFCE